MPQRKQAGRITLATRKKPVVKPGIPAPAENQPAIPVETPLATEPGFPIIGIGASAGALDAFEAFFSATPADTILLLQDNPDDEKLTMLALKQSNILNEVVLAHDALDARVIRQSAPNPRNPCFLCKDFPVSFVRFGSGSSELGA